MKKRVLLVVTALVVLGGIMFSQVKTNLIGIDPPIRPDSKPNEVAIDPPIRPDSIDKDLIAIDPPIRPDSNKPEEV